MFENLCQALLLQQVREQNPEVFRDVEGRIPSPWPQAKQARFCVSLLYAALKEDADAAIDYFEQHERQNVIHWVQEQIRTQCLPKEELAECGPEAWDFLDPCARHLTSYKEKFPDLQGTQEELHLGLLCLGFENYYQDLQREVHQLLRAEAERN